MATEESTADPPTRVMARLEVAVAVFMTLAAGSLAVFMPALIASGGIESAQSFTTLSPIFFPRLAFGLLALIGLGYVAQTVSRIPQSTRPRSAEGTVRLARAGLMTVVVILYAIAVPLLGFILATMVMTAIVAVFLGLRRPLAFVPGTIVIPIAIRFVFERMLLIALPGSSIDSVARVENAVMKFLADVILGW